MKKKLLLPALALAALCAPSAQAGVTYYYTGAIFHAPIESANITGSITLDAALPADLPLTDINPYQVLNFNFLGYFFSSFRPDPFFNVRLATDSSGHISSWSLLLFRGGKIIATDGDPSGGRVDIFQDGPFDYRSIGQGTWTNPGDTTTPEPASFGLMTASLLGLACAARWRTKSGGDRPSPGDC
jgi:hypothetical protein